MKQENVLKIIQSLFDKTFQWFVFVVLVIYSYGFLVALPYTGFSLAGDKVSVLFDEEFYDPSFVEGVQLIEINGINMEEYRKDYSLNLFDMPGAFERITIDYIPLGSDQLEHIDASIPGFTGHELYRRLLSSVTYAWFFWFVSLFVFALLRPKNQRWRLLIIFLNAFAIFLMSGNVSGYHIFGATLIVRLASWLFLPVSWHLHLIYPINLFELSDRTKRRFMWGSYGLFGGIGLLMMFDQSQLYAIPFLLGLAGSFVLLIVQAVRNPASRKKLGLFFGVQIFTLTFFAGIALLIARMDLGISPVGSALFVVPLIPLGYVYAIYRRQLADIRFRANPVIVIYLYLMMLVFSISGVLRLLSISGILSLTDTDMTNMFVFGLFISIFAVLFYDPFLKFIEKYILGIRLPSDTLLHGFNRQLGLILSAASLADLIQEDILPSMLIRQSALIFYEDEKMVDIAYHYRVDEISKEAALADLESIHQVSQWQLEEAIRPLGWVRLAIPLIVEEKRIGLWLFGEHDPEDYYVQKEIQMLEILAAPIAVSLQNMHQARNLRILYQVNLNRDEEQRRMLGQDLHDDVVNELSKLVLKMDQDEDIEKINKVIHLLRDVIAGLRPPVLDYGLRYGLYELSVDMDDEYPEINITFSAEQGATRYNEIAELQIFQIIRQACENALRHGQPKNIHITGQITPGCVELMVEDDGSGFVIEGGTLDIRTLLDAKKYGLAGMIERAEIIRAALTVDSSLGKGTRVNLRWCPEELREEDIQLLRFKS